MNIERILAEKALFDKEGGKVKEAPQVAIMFCISPRGNLDYPPGHKNFIVRQRNPSNSKELWDNANLGEFDTLAEAKSIAGAVPYPSAALCSACSTIAKTML